MAWCAPVFSCCVGEKKCLTDPSLSSWVHHSLSVWPWAKNLLSQNNVTGFVWKKKKNEVSNGCPVGDLGLLITVFVLICILVSWDRDHTHNPTKSSIIKTCVKYQRNSWIFEGRRHVGLGFTTCRDWTLASLITQQWGLYNSPWYSLLGWLCDPAQFYFFDILSGTKFFSWCMFPNS